MTLERATLTAIQRLLDRRGAVHTKINPAGMMRRGLPDIIGCYRGRTVVIEVKAPRGRTSALQDHELARWEKAGAWVKVARTVRDVEQVLDWIDGCAGELAA